MKKITVFSKPGLKIFLKASEDEIKLVSKGFLSSIVDSVLDKLNHLLENEKPISIEEEKIVFSTWLPPIPSEPFNTALKNELKRKILKKQSPQAVSLNISECTLECEECNIKDGKRLETEVVKDFIDDVQELGAFSLGFAEGEPLIRDDILELIEYVDKEKSIVSVFTPGTKLDEKMARELKKRDVHSVITGIKSADPEKHDEARGVQGAFEMAISGMKAALKNDLLVSMHTHAKPQMVRSGELEQIYELARDIGVHELTVWEPHPTWNYINDSSIMLNKKDREKINSLYERANNQEEGPRVFYNNKFESPPLFGCMAGDRWLNLIHSGDVTPCTYVPISFGNIKKDSLKKIWKRMSSHEKLNKKRSCVMQDQNFRNEFFGDIDPSDLPIQLR